MTTAVAEPKTAPSGVETAVTRMVPEILAPPFLSGWQQVPAGTPRGFWVDYRLTNQTGDVVLQIGTRPHPPAPTTIGWTWTGWKRPGLYCPAGAPIHMLVRTTSVTILPNGGHVVPRAFLSLHPRYGRPIESSRVLSAHPSGSPAHYWLSVSAERSGIHTLHAEFNFRSVFGGGAMPYGEIIGTFLTVHRHVRMLSGEALRGIDGEEMPADFAKLLQAEEREFTDEELAEQLSLVEKTPGIEIPEGPEAFVTPETT